MLLKVKNTQQSLINQKANNGKAITNLKNIYYKVTHSEVVNFVMNLYTIIELGDGIMVTWWP